MAILISLPVHELSHGFTARLFGDYTAQNRGRLTLNPLKHLDPIGTIMLLTLGFGWAKPVPVNINNFSNPKIKMAIVSLMGPVSNILLALIGTAFYKIAVILNLAKIGGVFIIYLMTFFNYFVMINLLLAVFNLIPIPPFDGSRIIMAFLPSKYYNFVMKYEQVGLVVIMALLFFNVLDTPLHICMTFLFKLCDLLFSPIEIIQRFIA